MLYISTSDVTTNVLKICHANKDFSISSRQNNPQYIIRKVESQYLDKIADAELQLVRIRMH